MREYVVNPDEFIPERWLTRKTGDREEEEDADDAAGACPFAKPKLTKPAPYVSMPFGHGARTCIGKRFAETIMAVAGVKINQNFAMRSEATEPLRLQSKIFTVPAQSLLFAFRERPAPSRSTDDTSKDDY